MSTSPDDNPSSENLVLAAWNAGFCAAAGSAQHNARFGDRTPAVSSGRSSKNIVFGDRPHSVSSPATAQSINFGVRTPSALSAAPFPLRPRFGQRARAKPPPRKPGGQPGNTNRLIHGYRSAAVEGPRRESMAELREAKALSALAAHLVTWKKTGKMPAALADLLAHTAP